MGKAPNPTRTAFQRLRADHPRKFSVYDLAKKTTVSSDCSSFGHGAVLMQKQPSGEVRPVASASRSMTETEASLLSNRLSGGDLNTAKFLIRTTF